MADHAGPGGAGAEVTGRRAGSPTRLSDLGFVDLPDYIEKITYRIWNGADRQPDLCLKYYAVDSAIHTDRGDLVGAEAVRDNTLERLEAFPDFHGTISDTVWVGDDDTAYRSSMRWTWTGTNTGPSIWGPPTGRRVEMSAIANCVVEDGVIVEEWLAFDPSWLAAQLGLTPTEAAAIWQPESSRPAREAPQPIEPATASGTLVADSLRAAFERGDPGPLLRAYTADAPIRLGGAHARRGGDGMAAWAQQWRNAVPGLAWTLEEQYETRAESSDLTRVASRWTLTAPADAGDRRLSFISHHHVKDGAVVAEWTQFDGLAALIQTGQEFPTTKEEEL